ncbi:Pol polyprotein [Plakobranchus ocellatus]|uniref:Pol polyprotein n=1 Tax=Plakobranchus ocellatus TaxID=259542 RepID=A0AAV4BJ55_9GAST|nr:Pol polyprotein [Plakobranchus ocellatus]
MLEKIHKGHLGTAKCKQRARGLLYWPRMSQDITDLISRCSTCLKHRNKHRKETLINHELGEYPWQKLGTDIFNFEGKEYLLVADYYSRYFEVVLLRDMKSSTLIAHFKAIFARFGIPEKLNSDNAANYTSQEFEEFLKNWDIDHITSSPRYPQSNGFAERMVQTAKKLLVKSKEEDPHIALLNYRTSPSQNLPSPAELLMGRKLRTKLPSLKSHHQTKNSQQELKQMKENQRQQRKHPRGFDLQPLEAGNDVFMRNQADTLWTPAKVVKKAIEPRSYILQQGTATYRRNRRQILKPNSKSFQHPTSVTRDDEEDQFPDVTKRFFGAFFLCKVSIRFSLSVLSASKTPVTVHCNLSLVVSLRVAVSPGLSGAGI